MAPPKDDAGSRGFAAVLRDSAPYLGLGTSLAGSLLVSLGIGYWADEKLGTAPVCFFVGAAFGLLAAFFHFLKMYRLLTGRKP